MITITKNIFVSTSSSNAAAIIHFGGVAPIIDVDVDSNSEFSTTVGVGGGEVVSLLVNQTSSPSTTSNRRFTVSNNQFIGAVVADEKLVKSQRWSNNIRQQTIQSRTSSSTWCFNRSMFGDIFFFGMVR